MKRIPRVQNMQSSNGNDVPNQFIITDEGHGALGNFIKREIFQSYNTVIAERTTWEDGIKIKLDRNKWDCSKTTGKYRNQFLGEGVAETRKKIASGEYELVDLN